jgi:3-oxoacyl-[acyl-carrier-protein] synthase II
MTSLAVTGWGVASAAATGVNAFAEAVKASASGLTDVSGMYSERLPEEQAYALTGFRIAELLGRKGTTAFDRVTALAVYGCGLALDDSDRQPDEGTLRDLGIVLGSTTGSLRSTSDYTRETYTQERPYLVNPVLFPNALINGATGHCAVWHGLAGLNTTISEGQLSGLAVLRYARNAIRSGYASALLAGSVEEFTPHSAWAAYHRRQACDGTVLPGEGVAMFVVEDAEEVRANGRHMDAEILAVEIGLGTDEEGQGEQAAVLTRCVRRALESAGVRPDTVWGVSCGMTGSPRFDAVEHRGVTEALGGEPARWLKVKEVVGETYSAAGSLQLAAVLGVHRAAPDLDGRIWLVTSVDPEGLVGVAVVRGWSR